MKNLKILSLLWVALIAWTLAGCGNNQTTQNNNSWDLIIEEIDTNTDVIAYNDNLVDTAQQCFLSEETIWTTYENESATTEDIQAAINSTVNTCRDTIDNINALGGWEWDTSLKDGIVAILEKDIEYYSKFSELLPYLDITDELTEDQAAVYDEIVNQINNIDDELSTANEDLMRIQETFASNHGYELDNWEA